MVVDTITNLIRSPFVIISTIMFIVLYKLVLQHWNFFDKIGIKFVRGLPLLGTQYQILLGKKSSFYAFLDLYRKYVNEEVIGMYDLGGSPMYVINDLEIVKQITTKDFDHFTNHRGQVDKKIEPILGRSMFMTHGQDWKDMRSATSPAFTGSKMKQMMLLLNECSTDLCENIKIEAANDGKVFDMKDLFQRYTANTIASSAFGLKVNCFEDKNNEFYQRGCSAAKLSGIEGVKIFAFQSIPSFMKFFKIQMFHKDDVEYFRKMISDNMKYREENNIRRPDMINIMMEAKKGSLQHDAKSDDIGFATVQESDYGKASIKHLSMTVALNLIRFSFSQFHFQNSN